LNKILETKLENDPGTLDALHSLSEFFSDNSLSNRRNLRGDMEKRSLRHNEDFCKCLQSVTDQLEEIHKDIEAIAACHQDMSERLKATRSVTTELVRHTAQLRSSTKEVEMKSKVAAAFLAKFQLSEEEMHWLKGRPGEDISPEFFSVLCRVREIHENCKQLLRTSQQRLGLEIMERMAMYQEAAFERLYHWILTQVHNASLDSSDLPQTVRQGLLTLQERPILFDHSISELSQARRSLLVQAFIDALTRGGPGGMPRPIELFSHDALRYVGDMFGWLHQGLASERDFLVGIFGKMDEKIPDTLAQVTEGVCRPLRVRVEQVIVSELPSTTAFKVSSLLRFYLNILTDFVPAKSQLVTTCREMSEFSIRVFISNLHSTTNRLLESVEMPSIDLVPLKGFKETVLLMQEILGDQDLTKVHSKEFESDLPQIFTAIVEPLLQFCNETAAKLSSPPSTAVYLINCLYSLHSTLSVYEFTDHWLEKLAGQQQAYVDTLVDHQASHYLVAGKLGDIYTPINQKTLGTMITQMPGYRDDMVKKIASGLSSVLSAPDQYELPQCALIQSPNIRTSVHRLSVEMFIRSYTEVHAALQEDPALTEHVKMLPEPSKLKELLT
jgi:hypothetical protein